VGPERDHGERRNAGIIAITGAIRVDRAIGVRGRDALLEEELDAVRERNQDAARTGAHQAPFAFGKSAITLRSIQM